MRAGSPTGPWVRLSGEQAGPYRIAVAIALPSPRKDLEVRLKPKGPEEYRRLAEKCRETAHTVSTEKERADLLAMAQIWDLIAGRVGQASRCERPAAVTDHGHRVLP